MEVRLTQIEKSDVNKLKDLFMHDNRDIWGQHKECTKQGVEDWISSIMQSETTHLFAIRYSRDIYKHFLVGVGGIQDIDWISRHGRLLFLMPEEIEWESLILDVSDIVAALRLILNFCFFELNLNKVWIEIHNDDPIKQSLEGLGFVAEGIGRSSLFYAGKFIDTIFLSVLLAEYK